MKVEEVVEKYIGGKVKAKTEWTYFMKLIEKGDIKKAAELIMSMELKNQENAKKWLKAAVSLEKMVKNM